MDKLRTKMKRLHNFYQISLESLAASREFVEFAQAEIIKVLKRNNLTRFEDTQGNLWVLTKNNDLRYMSRESRLCQNPKAQMPPDALQWKSRGLGGDLDG